MTDMSTKKKRKMSNNSTPVSQTFAIWLGGQRQRSFLFSVLAEGTRRAQRKERDFLSTGRDVFVLFQTPAPGHTQQPDRWQLDGRRRRRHRFWQTKKQPGDARSNLRAWKRGRRSAEEVKLMPFSCWPDAGARRNGDTGSRRNGLCKLNKKRLAGHAILCVPLPPPTLGPQNSCGVPHVRKRETPFH